MGSFGYSTTSGGLGASTAVAFYSLSHSIPNVFAYPFVNNSGGPLSIDTAALINVVAPITASGARVAVYDSQQQPGGIAEGLLGLSDLTAPLAVGPNSFSFPTPFIVDDGAQVWVVLLAANNGTILCSGADRLDYGLTYQLLDPTTGSAPNPFPAPGWIRSAVILPINLSGSTPGSMPTTFLREAVAVNEPLMEGDPFARAALAINEPVSEGDPFARAALALSEPLAEGDPYIRAALSVLETLIAVPEEPEMVTDVFPTLQGLAWSVTKTPNFNSQIRKSTSNRAVRNSLTPYPVWNFQLSFDYLPNDDGTPNVTLGTTDLKYLMGFFLKQHGREGEWLFRDPTDYAVTAGAFGTGDAVTVAYKLARNMGGLFLEPVGQLSAAVQATFLPAAVNTGSDTITVTAHGLATGDGPFFVASTLTVPAGLAAGAPYWIVGATTNTFQLAATRGGAAVNITGAGTGVLTLTDGFAVYLSGPEPHTVPGVGPYTVTAARTPIAVDNGVTLDSSGAALTYVGGAPSAGQYTVNLTTGVYTFNAAQAAAAVHIDYLTQVDPAGYAFSGQNLLTFTSAPADGLTISGDFRFYFVCSFLEDKADFENFEDKLWSMQELDFESNIT